MDLVTRAYYQKSEDALLLLASFRPFSLARAHDRLTVEVAVSREVLADARGANLQRLPPPAQPSTPPRNLTALRSLKAEVLEWQGRRRRIITGSRTNPATADPIVRVASGDDLVPFPAALWFK